MESIAYWIEKADCFIEKRERTFLVVMMLLSSFILAYPLRNSYPLHTTTDELGAIVGAAGLAGYDWSGVIDMSGYYGFGYYILFAPLFKMHLSPILIYRIILIVTRIFRGCAISGMAYYLGKHYLGFSSKFVLMQFSVICIFPLHPLNNTNIINDIVLDIFFWFSILTVCKITEWCEEVKRCLIWIVLYLLNSFFVLFLHTRAIVIVIASFLVSIGIFIYKKKKIFLISMITIPIIGVSKVVIKLYQNWLWDVSDEGLRNGSVIVNKGISIFDLKVWKIWATMLIGHMTVQTLLSGGLFLLVVTVAFRYCFRCIKNRKSDGSIYVNIMFLISFMCMGAVFLAFMVSSWVIQMYETWDTIQKGQDYAYKALCYVRYWNVFFMPALLVGMFIFCKKEYQICMRETIYAGILLILCFINFVLPIIKSHNSAASFLYTYLTMTNEKISAQFYYKSILICFFFSAIAIMIYKSKIRKISILSIIFLLIIGYNWANINFNEYIKQQISSMVLASYEVKCQLENEDINIGYVYAYDDRDVESEWAIYSVLQFYFYEYRIEDEYPAEVASNDIIITNHRSKKIEEDFPNLSCYQLDDNEIWYTEIKLGESIPMVK